MAASSIKAATRSGCDTITKWETPVTAKISRACARWAMKISAAGGMLTSAARRRTLERAKDELRIAFGRQPKAHGGHAHRAAR